MKIHFIYRKRKERDEPMPKPARQKKASNGQKRQKVVRDIDENGQPLTQISTASIRKFLSDPSSLLRPPSLISKEEIAASANLCQVSLLK